MSKRKRPKPPSKRKALHDPCAMLSRLAWFFVAAGRQLGDDDEKIARDIKQGFIDALSTTTVPITHHDFGKGPEEVVSCASGFQSVLYFFGLDVSDQVSQETWLAAVERAIKGALSRTDGEYARRRKLTPVQTAAALTVTARRMAGQSDSEIRDGCLESFLEILSESDMLHGERLGAIAEFNRAIDAEIARTRPQ